MPQNADYTLKNSTHINFLKNRQGWKAENEELTF